MAEVKKSESTVDSTPNLPAATVTDPPATVTTPTQTRRSAARRPTSLRSPKPLRAPSPAATPNVAAPSPRPKTAIVPPLNLSADYDWTKGQLLGKGRCTNCHEVIKVPRTKDGKMVAVRMVASPICRFLNESWPKDVRHAWDEVKKLTKLPVHENLITFRACPGVDDKFSLGIEPKPFMEVEYFREGSLNSKIQKKFELRGAFTHRQILRFMHQLTLGVAFLHSHGILHRDIRPKNIFIVEPDTLKLGDLGGPKIVQNRSHCSRWPGAFWTAQNRLNGGPNHCLLSPPNSWPYTPIEIMCEFKIPATKDLHITHADHYVAASDVWSMGVVLFELLCLKVPFPGRTPKQVQKSIGNQMPLAQILVPAVRDYPNELRLLPRRMLCLDPNERIKTTDLEKLLRYELQRYDMFKAAKEGDLNMVESLVNNEHADVNMTDSAGYTPLMWAAENGYVDVVKFLMDHGANAAAKNRHGWTAQDWADNKDVLDTLKSSRLTA